VVSEDASLELALLHCLMVLRAERDKVVEHVVSAKVAPYEVVKLHAVAHTTEPTALYQLVPAHDLPVFSGGLVALGGLGVGCHLNTPFR
jgi:hypothetical protein